RQVIHPTGGTTVPGTQIVTIDDFGTHNQFNGGDIGLRARLSWSDFTLGLLAKAAVGRLDREIRISGGQVTAGPGSAPAFGLGGVFALSSNIGAGIPPRGDWTIRPECGADVGWQLNSHVRVYLGYSIIFLDDIARSADQIDLTVNPNLFPPAAAGAAGP